MTNLWTDVEALARLHRTSRAVEREVARAGGCRPTSFSFHDCGEVEIATAGTAAKVVSGDLVDHFPVREDTLAVAVADVSGKGMPAALLMEAARSMLRGLCTVEASPAGALRSMNRALHETDLDSMYLTLFLGWYRLGSGRLIYANAGHPRPCRVRAEGGVAPFGEITGPLLGILDAVAYEDREERIEVGETLVLYTDGVTEARGDDGDLFGCRRLLPLLERHAGDSVGRLCGAVARGVEEHRGPRRDDDLTVMAFRRRA